MPISYRGLFWLCYVLFGEAPEQTWSTEKLCGLPVVVLKTHNRAVMETWVFWTPA